MLPRIPKVQTEDRNINQLQNNILTGVNPFFNNALLDGVLLQNLDLVSGDTTINHKLGRKLIGWFIVKIDAAATIFEQPSTMPDLTLILNSSAPVTVSLYCF